MVANPVLKEVEIARRKMIANEGERRLAELREKYTMEMASARNDGLNEGIEMGRREGNAEEREKIKKKMQQLGDRH